MPRNYTVKGCEWCGNNFTASRCDARYCSSACRNKQSRFKALLSDDVQNKLFSILDTAIAGYANALNQLSPKEIMKAADIILNETKEQRAERTESFLYTLLKGKE